MYTFYKLNERITNNELWGESIDTFFASDNEKYLGFGNLVQLTRTTLKSGDDYKSMELLRNKELVDVIINGSFGFQDSLGQVSSFPANTVQVVSAGKGIYQGEYNSGNAIAEKIRLGFFPDKLNQPSIKNKALFNFTENKNVFLELVSPVNVSSLTIRQQAAVLIGEFDANNNVGYRIPNRSVGLFVYVVKGTTIIHNNFIVSGEAVGIRNEEQTIFHTVEPSIVLLIEVEMIEQLENK